VYKNQFGLRDLSKGWLEDFKRWRSWRRASGCRRSWAEGTQGHKVR